MRLVYSFSPLRQVLGVFDDFETPHRLFVQNATDVLPDTVFLGRLIKRVQNAWFVDLGKERQGYLYTPKTYFLNSGIQSSLPLTEGLKIFVKAKRESFESKDVKLSANVALEFIQKDLSKIGEVFIPKTVFETYQQQGCIFETDDLVLEELIEHSLDKEVMLPGGGSIIIEQTSACVCIDVNARGQSENQANQEAVSVILQQIALRSLSGQMIIDFAGHKKQSTLAKLVIALKQNDIDLRIVGISGLGLVEMTKERREKSLDEAFKNPIYTQACLLSRALWVAQVRGVVTVFAPIAVLEILRPYMNDFKTHLNTEIILKQALEIYIEGIKQ